MIMIDTTVPLHVSLLPLLIRTSKFSQHGPAIYHLSVDTDELYKARQHVSGEIFVVVKICNAQLSILLVVSAKQRIL